MTGRELHISGFALQIQNILKHLTGFTGLTGYKKESSKFQVQWFKAKS
jgi:hypothetical protein